MSSVVEPVATPEPPIARERRRSRRLILAAWLVAGVAAIVAFLTVSLGRPSGSVDTPIVGRPAPAFDLRTLDGRRVSLADLRGSPMVLNFWASWCIPCREEAPLLTSADATYRSNGLRILGVIYQDSSENASDFMARYGQTYPGLLDPDGRTAIDYGVFGIPETFFIDRTGVVRSRQVGPLTEADLRRQIDAVLR
jgi:cytochrome c biogenesis protein CcmG/thiol:disulfide interchange protein DsbE